MTQKSGNVWVDTVGIAVLNPLCIGRIKPDRQRNNQQGAAKN